MGAAANIDVVIDCDDPDALAGFWAEALGYRKLGRFDEYFVLIATKPGHPPLLLQKVPEAKGAKNRVHLDIRAEDVEDEVARLEALGARRVDVGQGEGRKWVTMADPEGNEFCVCPGVPLPGELTE
jgi:catechol 2,3-dioxygenase-like lactoylglutathione lyase family enzyme